MPSPTTNIMMSLKLTDGEWKIRIEARHTENGQKHIHLKRNKLKGEYSWNLDGSRHDQGKFPKNEKAIRAAKKMTAKHLGVDESILKFIVAEPISRTFIILESNSRQNDLNCMEGILHMYFPEHTLLIVCEENHTGHAHILFVNDPPIEK